MRPNRLFTLFLPLALLMVSCTNNTKSDTSNAESTPLAEVKVVQYEALQAAYSKQDNVLYVVNFWATWCAPCVKELPDFMAVNDTFKKKENYHMILVSLDDVNNLETGVKPMIKDLNLAVEHYLLDDVTRMNTWIPAIHPSWQGTIPATLFIRNGKALHFEGGPLNKTALTGLIQSFLQ
ncbi:MAG: redoxin domain-containing protein [Bacteroidales bacterium]|nr:redoxin domain-containing protein [Bacteroidales bacterium]